MDRQLTELELEQIATQLGRPEGELGIMTAERMAHTNNNMTKSAIDALHITGNDVILEIGPGNGTHVKYVMDQAAPIRYYGADISDTMIAEANKINKELVNTGGVSFELTTADKLNFRSDFFDKIFTVNTLYFWEDPAAYAEEIRRVLKPDGLFCLAIATKQFMESLPFTKFKFKLYDVLAVKQLLADAGFLISNISEQQDLTTSHTGDIVKRDIVIVTAKKN